MTLKKYIVCLILIFSLLITLNDKAYSANGVIVSVESLFIPLGKTDLNDPRSLTLMFGVRGFSELHENIRLNYGVSVSNYNGYILSLPISIAYVPTADYKFNLRPQIFAGIEPFYSNIQNFSGLKWYGNVGLALDYNFSNNLIFNVTAKTYINESFFQSKPVVEAFNTGVVSLSTGIGYKFQ